MFGFYPSIFPFLETSFVKFLEKYSKDLTEEFLLPEILQTGIKDKKCQISVLSSSSSWMGVTYKEDVPNIKNKLNELIKNKEYPEDLWNLHS
ncbi:MAG: hypothetical protein PHX04_04190 [Bacilli bacterium]|nr:hypothetical protein [Bacilli bacterium]